MKDALKTVHVYRAREEWMHCLVRNGDCFCEPDCQLMERRGIVTGRVVIHQQLLKKRKKQGMRAGITMD